MIVYYTRHFIVLFVYISISCFFAEKALIRIVPGIDRLSDESFNNLNANPLSGPEELYFLDGTCFTYLLTRYMYSICPFRNVTQQRLNAPNSRPQLLGSWSHFIVTYSNATESTSNSFEIQKPYIFSAMEFNEGASCGVDNKKAKVKLICRDNNNSEDVDFQIIKGEEINECEYTFDLAIPLSCSLFTTAAIGGQFQVFYGLRVHDNMCVCPTANNENSIIRDNDEDNIENLKDESDLQKYLDKIQSLESENTQLRQTLESIYSISIATLHTNSSELKIPN